MLIASDRFGCCHGMPCMNCLCALGLRRSTCPDHLDFYRYHGSGVSHAVHGARSTSPIVQAAWARGQPLGVHGLIYHPGEGHLKVLAAAALRCWVEHHLFSSKEVLLAMLCFWRDTAAVGCTACMSHQSCQLSPGCAALLHAGLHVLLQPDAVPEMRRRSAWAQKELWPQPSSALRQAPPAVCALLGAE